VTGGDIVAIEKMALLQIVGSIDEMHPILKKLVICENVHLNLESSNAYSNSYLVHEYESNVISMNSSEAADYDAIQSECKTHLQTIEDLCRGLDIELKIDSKYLTDEKYGFDEACSDLDKIVSSIGYKAETIKNKKNEITELLFFKNKIDCNFDKNIELDKIKDLNYFEYAIGTLSRENKWRIKIIKH
jgi:V/A-type H+-transporting ATPase subunit I